MTRRRDYTPRTDGPGSGRRARGPVHRVAFPGFVVVVNPGTPQWLRVETEQCRCMAWRARVQVGTRVLVTDWSAPCSDPSPAPARDDAPADT